jgi:outer membrane protein
MFNFGAQFKKNIGMKKTFVKFFLLTACIFAFGGVSAQKFGHIDFAKLFVVMPGQDTIQEKYRQYADGLRVQLEAMQTEWETKITDYQSKSSTMTDLIRRTKEKELQDLQGRIEAFQQQANIDLQNKETELTTPLIERAKKAIQDVANENGYTYVFNSAEGLLLVAPPSDDIMPLVKKKLGIKE